MEVKVIVNVNIGIGDCLEIWKYYVYITGLGFIFYSL